MSLLTHVRAAAFRLYTVDPSLLVRVTLKNLSLSTDVLFAPVYITETGIEEPEKVGMIKSHPATRFTVELSTFWAWSG